MSRGRCSDGGGGEDLAFFRRRVVSVVAILGVAAALATLTVLIFDILLVVFGGVLLAVLLRAISDPLAARTPLTPGWSVALVIVAFGAVLGVSGWLLAPSIATQVDVIVQQVPEVFEAAREWLESYGWGQRVVDALEEALPPDTLTRAGDLFARSGMFLVHLFTFFFVGLFLAMRPTLYTNGLLYLLPVDSRPRGREVLFLLGRTLRWFLIGRLLAMTMVGVSTAIVLSLLGVPLAVFLGVVAGLLTFVPYLGPILGGLPILFVALLDSPILALWAIVAYTALQWVEGYVLDPLIQQRMVELPPAVTVTSQVVLGVLAGGIGIAVATPLSAVVMVLVQTLWVRGVLGDSIHIGPRGFRRKKRSRKKKAASPGRSSGSA